MRRWKQGLSLILVCTLFLGLVAFTGMLPTAADTAQRNLLQNADGTADAGKYGGWLTKYVYGAADAPGGNTLDLTGAAYAAAERDWDDEKPGKAVDGNTAAGTGDTFFMTLPDATDTQARLGLLVDLQEEYTLSRLSYFNNKYIAGGHRRYRGTVYAGNVLNNLAKAATFDTYNNGDALQVDITLETTARHVFVAFNERNAFCSMARKTGTFTGIALDEVQVWGGAVQRTVRFDYAGADSGDEESTRTVENGAAVGTLPAPQKTGEEFLGWFDGNGVLWDGEAVVTGDVTLTARWGQNLIGGKAEAWFTKAYGNAAALPQVTETAFSADENVSKATDGNKNANGGFTGNDMFKLKPVDGSDSVGFRVDLPELHALTLFKLTMTTQTGWMEGNRAAKGYVYTSENGTDWDAGTVFDNSAKSEEIEVALTGKRARHLLVMITNPDAIQFGGAVRIYETELFAAPAVCTVRFENCEIEDKAVQPGDTLDLSAEMPTQNNDWFMGYYTDAECTVPFINGSTITADTTLYAGWITVRQAPQVQAVQVRLVGKEGLRFISQIDEEAVAQLQALDGSAELGTLVALKNKVDGGFDRTNPAIEAGYMKSVEAIKRLRAGQDYTADGTVKFTAVVIEIPEAHYATDIAARTYVTYTDASGIQRSYYSHEDSSEYYATNLAAAAQVTLDQYGETLTDREKERLNAIMAAAKQ